MSIENGLSNASKERVVIATVATLVFTAPVAGYLVKKELSLRKTKKEQQVFAEQNLQEAIKVSKDSNNSGDSGFLFQQE